MAMDSWSRQSIAFHVGDRSGESTRKLWEPIPESYRDKATFYTDDWQVYEGVIPKGRHRVVKGNQKTASALVTKQPHRWLVVGHGNWNIVRCLITRQDFVPTHNTYFDLTIKRFAITVTRKIEISVEFVLRQPPVGPVGNMD